MFVVYERAIELCGLIAEVAEVVAERDGDLARQMRRAVASVALNLGEGAGSTGGTRRARYSTALGSAREVEASLRVARAMRYVRGEPAELQGALDHVIGALVRLVHSAR
jgi:four helix bundle protein